METLRLLYNMDLKEINTLSETVPNSINKIEWWLLKYSDQFKEIEKVESVKHLYKLEDGSVFRLPPLLVETGYSGDADPSFWPC